MHKLQNGSQIVAKPPLKNTTGSLGYFTESGESGEPSYPGADWFNASIDEFSNVLTAAGIEFESGKFDHLARGIANIASSTASIVSKELTTHEDHNDPHPDYVLNAELTAHEDHNDPHPDYVLNAELTAHEDHNDPHPNYVLNAELMAHENKDNPHSNYLLKSALSNSYSGKSESKATTEKALSEGLAEKVSNTNHSLKSYFSLEELGLTDEDFAENTLKLLISSMNQKSLAYIAINVGKNISALMPTSASGTLYIEKLSAWQFTLKFIELYKNTPTPYIATSFIDNTPGAWIKLQNGEKSKHVTLAENIAGWGGGAIVDWSGTGYVRDDFDFILITGQDTSYSTAAGSGNVSTLMNKTLAKNNGRINLITRSRAGDFADYLILQTSAIGTTSMSVFVQKQGLLDGVITGIYGIKF